MNTNAYFLVDIVISLAALGFMITAAHFVRKVFKQNRKQWIVLYDVNAITGSELPEQDGVVWVPVQVPNYAKSVADIIAPLPR